MEQPEEHEMREVTHDSMMDPQSRRNFYVNKKTGRSTWTENFFWIFVLVCTRVHTNVYVKFIKNIYI